MVVTFVLPGRSLHKPIGGFKIVYEFANHLAERDYRVNVIHPLLLYPRQANLLKKGDAFARLIGNSVFGIPKLNWFSISPKVNMMVVPSLEERYVPLADAIIATAWQTAESVVGYGRNKGDKFYLIQHYEDWSGEEKRVQATWHLPLKKIVVARWLQKVAIEMGESEVIYIPRGIDFSRFYLTQPIEKRFSKRIGLYYHDFDWKGSPDAIKALKIVKDKVNDIQAVFFSTCRKDSEVPNWIEYYQNPTQSKLREIYNSCSIFLSPNWSGEWGLPSAEAMVCGCALVCTDSNGAEEYGFHEKTALVSRPKDSIALAQNILKLLQDNDFRIKLAKQGNEYIKRFNWDEAITKLEEVLQQK